MSVIAQSFDSGFDLKPMRRRSANASPAFTPAVLNSASSAATTLPGADYFLSTRIANSTQRPNVQIEKPAHVVDSQIKDLSVRRRASAPPTSNVYPAVTTQAPQVTIRRVADGLQERPEYQNEFPALRSDKENLKRRASYPPALKSCFPRYQNHKEETGRKSVQFFGFVQVQYTHSPSDYDRTAIACIANGGLSEASRAEQLEELRLWQQEMTQKMPAAPTSIETPVMSSIPEAPSATIAEISSPAPMSVDLPAKPSTQLKPVPQSKPQRSQRRNRNRSKVARAN